MDKEQRRQLLRQSEETLRRCLALDPSDARTYVVLGKTFMQQKRYDEARKLYTEGTDATGERQQACFGWRHGHGHVLSCLTLLPRILPASLRSQWQPLHLVCLGLAGV